jgi:polyisoprenoid-binding protein YceI
MRKWHRFNQARLIVAIAVCMCLPKPATEASSTTARYQIDAGRSTFIVRVLVGGLLSAFGHNHTIAVRDFTGEAEFTYVTFEPASLRIKVRAASLAVLDKVSQKEREQIERTMREQVLEVDKYPEIVFKSTAVSATKIAEGQYRVEIRGELSLHGEVRSLTIPALVELSAASLRARGQFSLRQTDYKIQPVSIAAGTIKVKDELKLSFDIVAHR